MEIKFLEIAQLELDETFAYYEYQQKKLGFRFINEVQKSIELIRYYPQGWHPLSKYTRRCLIKNFPYGLVYQIKEDYILVVAVVNLHRKPNYWVKRIVD
ncbi:MAG: type II toxin-antitoxin system RelE/ParE family toxin [Arcobacteraceae bacterium]